MQHANHITIAVIFFRSGGCGKRSEIVLALKLPCGNGHGLYIERPRVVERSAIFERRQDAPLINTVTVRLPLREPARVEFRAGLFGGDDADSGGPQALE